MIPRVPAVPCTAAPATGAGPRVEHASTPTAAAAATALPNVGAAAESIPARLATVAGRHGSHRRRVNRVEAPPVRAAGSWSRDHGGAHVDVAALSPAPADSLRTERLTPHPSRRATEGNKPPATVARLTDKHEHDRLRHSASPSGGADARDTRRPRSRDWGVTAERAAGNTSVSRRPGPPRQPAGQRTNDVGAETLEAARGQAAPTPPPPPLNCRRTWHNAKRGARDGFLPACPPPPDPRLSRPPTAPPVSFPPDAQPHRATQGLTEPHRAIRGHTEPRRLVAVWVVPVDLVGACPLRGRQPARLARRGGNTEPPQPPKGACGSNNGFLTLRERSRQKAPPPRLRPHGKGARCGETACAHASCWCSGGVRFTATRTVAVTWIQWDESREADPAVAVRPAGEGWCVVKRIIPRLVKAQCIRSYGFLKALLHMVGSYIQMQLLIGRLPSCRVGGWHNGIELAPTSAWRSGGKNGIAPPLLDHRTCFTRSGIGGGPKTPTVGDNDPPPPPARCVRLDASMLRISEPLVHYVAHERFQEKARAVDAKQEDNQSAIVWARGPLERLQATGVETSGQKNAGNT
ncbi:hypothetical protein BU14_0346s0018 [Porphyra umbilicalis]|uniref:Uncharacterized protein n=1 Tax=Porphyra umbilicalis TaxID=2786 RepID=A0A1X6NY44_PORUM|nr:hypothetical protein BU14_0346s0018 [Porphyra umbilicalis]|eukprot:OSX73465.1 hypothetical protein BU14_0346s0018 [Porphyra umbilicalis]